ncbi:MAG TPA: protein kinase [Gemmatimonadaceae bacterium]|nr:protein kinase [Gemmatimonadaceae bacterium]
MTQSHADHLAAVLADRYRLERELGAGGMATVYLAEDLKHHRRVAIKVLHAELSAILGPERFLKEIELTASLQHPHILPLFDSGSADGLLYYVMPFVEGGALRGRLEREKQLPIADAVRIATEVADALDYAHTKGVIHRDIKPENILLRDGHALVADFGIALAVEQAGGERMTQTGFSLGTPQYMSPEQAMGEREIGPRSDIYSLGVVTYEMLTGDPPFMGSTAQAIVAQVITAEPRSLRVQRKSVPPQVEDAVLTALEKLPADRFASGSEFARALASTGRIGPPSRRASARQPRPVWYSDWRSWVTIAALVIAAAAVWRAQRPAQPSAPALSTSFVFAPPANARVAKLPPRYRRLALSPDGSMLVYVGASEDSGRVRRQLYRRALDRLDALPVAGTDSAVDPFFSPDGRRIGYYTGSAIRTVRRTGGAATTVADSLRGVHGAVWTDHGTIVFAWKGDLWRVSDTGGAPEALSSDSARRVEEPVALPGGDRFLFLACQAAPCESPVPTALDPATHRMRQLLDMSDVDAMWYVSPGTLLVQRENGEFWAVALDPATLTLHGTPRRVLAATASPSLVGAEVAVSPGGTMAAIPEALAGLGELVWVDRAGTVTPITHQPRQYRFPRLSPDGRKVAMEIRDDAGVGFIWVYDLTSHTLTRLSTTGRSTRPIWSPDSKRVAYISLRGDSSGIYVTPVDRSAPERPLFVGPVDYFNPLSWSSDGRWIATERLERAGGGSARAVTPVQIDLIAIPVGGGTPRVIRGTPANERSPAFSPDGKWLAYTSNESGHTEVYVTPFPGPGGRWTVSAGGGDEPEWARSGSALFYRLPDGWLTAAQLSLGAEVTVTRRERLFSMSLNGDFAGVGETPYDVAPGGQRFVMVQPLGGPSSIVMTTEWTPRVMAIIARQQSNGRD